MDHTLKYLMEQEFDSPFDFFQAFGDYWEGQGWQKIGHQLEDLFTRLHSFLESRNTPHMDIVLGLMKLDYFLGHKYKPRKIWWDDALEKDQWALYMKTLAERPEDVRLPRCRCRRHGMAGKQRHGCRCRCGKFGCCRGKLCRRCGGCDRQRSSSVRRGWIGGRWGRQRFTCAADDLGHDRTDGHGCRLSPTLVSAKGTAEARRTGRASVPA